MVSSIFSINLRELIKGFLIAFLGALATALKGFFTSGTMPMTWSEWVTILVSGMAAGFLYVVATFVTGPAPSNTEKQKVLEIE